MIDKKTPVNASTMPISSLVANLESLAHMMQSPILREAANRLRTADFAANMLDDSLFYARMYRDTTVEGANLRRMLIDDAETVVSLIRNGGCE